VNPADERRHAPGEGALWGESWYVDFSRDDGLGGFVRLGLYPNLGVAWWWTHLLVPGRHLVAVRDHDVPLPRGQGLEVRADGLWADLICETPLEHWSIGLEAFGVGLDDPAEAWGDEWGERLPVGLDLEWEAAGPPAEGLAPGPAPGPEGGGYTQAGRVRGDLLIGDARIDFDGPGLRARSWGTCDWWSAAGAGHWAAWHDDAGRTVLVGGPGWPGGPSVELVDLKVTADGLPTGASYRLDGQPVEATVLGLAPILLGAPGRSARLARALCRFTGLGGEGTGWAEWIGV